MAGTRAARRPRLVDATGGEVAPQQYAAQQCLGFQRPFGGTTKTDLRLWIGLTMARAFQHAGAILGVPCGITTLLHSRGELLMQDGQVEDILRGIFQLLRTERTAQPVRTRFALGQVDVEQGCHQLLVAESCAKSGESRGDLGIKQLPQASRNEAHQSIQILAGAVHHRDGLRVRQTRGKLAALQGCQWINQAHLAIKLDLQQGELGMESVGAHEFRIHTEQMAGAGKEGVQRLGRVDPGCQRDFPRNLRRLNGRMPVRLRCPRGIA